MCDNTIFSLIMNEEVFRLSHFLIRFHAIMWTQTWHVLKIGLVNVQFTSLKIQEESVS